MAYLDVAVTDPQGVVKEIKRLVANDIKQAEVNIEWHKTGLKEERERPVKLRDTVEIYDTILALMDRPKEPAIVAADDLVEE